jgi:cellulose synthase/poly-beta-1,6-N-acetylglucosamine synthase-like glycosyltransferase
VTGAARGDGADTAVDVSVVIPVGRVDHELELQLAALAAQSHERPWELVLSLNTSDAEARAELEALVARHAGHAAGAGDGPAAAEPGGSVTGASMAGPGFVPLVVDSSDLRSASHARNVGAAAASGRLLAFCDGDDIADVDWLRHLVGALGEARAVGGHLDESVLAVPGQEDWRPPATPGGLPTFLGHPFLVSANMGVHRDDFEAVGGFDTTLIRGEDIALSWDLLERGVELAYCAPAVIHYRHRRGLWPMMKQHYLYGRGFSQILARRGIPGQDGSAGLGSLRPNNQAAARKNFPYVARRGSIALGRVVGLVEERLSHRTPSPG